MGTIRRLSYAMSEKQFDNGYWYATQIKAFAKQLGIKGSAKLRKDELEDLIRHFLRTGKIKNSSRKTIQKKGIKDIDKGLHSKLIVVNYTSDKQTKDFIIKTALKQAPGLKERSGVRYRLNRWREEQITKGKKITYGDLVKQYILFNQSEKPFKKARSGRYINFLAEFLKKEKGAGHPRAREV